MMKVDEMYVGTRYANGDTSVLVGGRPLDARYSLNNQSSTLSMNWGYIGSGPLQLAIAMLAHRFAATNVCGSDEVAIEISVEFRDRVIAALDTDHWQIEGKTIDKAVASFPIEREMRRKLASETSRI